MLSIVIGEGGSAAPALPVANEVWMRKTPFIPYCRRRALPRSSGRTASGPGEAAGVMKITARELYELGIIERVIPEEEPACKETLPACFLSGPGLKRSGGLERRGSGGDGTPPGMSGSADFRTDRP